MLEVTKQFVYLPNVLSSIRIKVLSSKYVFLIFKKKILKIHQTPNIFFNNVKGLVLVSGNLSNYMYTPPSLIFLYDCTFYLRVKNIYNVEISLFNICRLLQNNSAKKLMLTNQSGELFYLGKKIIAYIKIQLLIC